MRTNFCDACSKGKKNGIQYKKAGDCNKDNKFPVVDPVIWGRERDDAIRKENKVK